MSMVCGKPFQLVPDTPLRSLISGISDGPRFVLATK